MKLSICIDSDLSDNSDLSRLAGPDSEIYTSEKFLNCLEKKLVEIYPASKNFENVELSLTFMKPEEIRELNRTYRNVDQATDVLSFPLINDDEELSKLPVLSLGDIVICPEETKRLHPELDNQEAILLMIAHSFLHLLGYDHDTDEKEKIMWEKQDELKNLFMEAVK